uniref:Sodium channel protein Nach n=1 Tax=Bursaphelenchus xylophilus TaxID=6326 RepID=A0A1I7SJH9_BURXY
MGVTVCYSNLTNLGSIAKLFSMAYNIEGKDTACFVRNWLTSNVVDQYNCTLPYLTDIPNVPPRNVCDPVVVVREYFHTIQLVHSGSVHSQECVPGCKRWEYGVSLQQSQALDNFTGFKFNLEASFYDLQYEHVKEVYTTSVPGFMSQIGGQFGFFLGLSIITMIQIGIYLISYVFNFFYKLFKQSPEDENEDNQDPTMTDYNGAIPSNGHVRTNGLQMVDGVLYSNRVRPVANGHMMSSWM